MNDLMKEWAAKADTLQKIRYVVYIDSLRARQQNLQDMLQVLYPSTDLTKDLLMDDSLC